MNKKTLCRTLLGWTFAVTILSACSKQVKEPSPEGNGDSQSNNRKAKTNALSLSDIIYHENADGSTLFSTYVSKQVATTYGIQQTISKFYNGTKSARFELRDTDPEVQNGTRAEVTFPEATNLERWYSYAQYVPSDSFAYDNDDDVITQWHQGGGATPALCLRVKQDHLYIRVLGAWTDLGTFIKNRWVSYILHVKHSDSTDGLIEMWIDGVKVLNKTGANMYTVTGSYHNPNWKIGVYKSDWNGSGTTNTNIRVLYFDDIKMGDEDATYADMAPTCNAFEVTGFNLVNSATESEVRSINNNDTMSISALGFNKMNITAITSHVSPWSHKVRFELTGQESKTYTDNAFPYALHGDDGNGNFYYSGGGITWNPPATGTYTLKAIPITTSGSDTGIVKTINFTFIP